MRWTTALLVILLANLSSTAYSQITLRVKNAPLQMVLNDIEKQTKYVFLYDPNDLKIPPITVSIRNATLNQTLAIIFKGLSIESTTVGKNILLKKSANIPITTPETPIHGKVVDSTGQPLPGVTVFAERERKGTQTDTTGTYALKAAKGDILHFSFVGFKDREITIGDQRLINATLEVNPSSPDQVVVIGYGSSKKKDLTGAVSIVDVKDIGEIPFNSFDNALAGKAAGVEVTKTDGTPGGMSRIRVRGSSSLLGGNDPLYVIDGIPVQVRNNFIDPGFKVPSPGANLSLGRGGTGAALPASFVNGLNSLAEINPDDIESIAVLKDASSTAIYGSKAANGVVIVTTKTGVTNSPARVVVLNSTTLTTLYKSPKVLDASQYKTLLTEAAQNAFNADSAQGFFDPYTTYILDSPAYFGAANTPWIKKVTRTTVSNTVGLSVSGGGQASKYFTSLSYTSIPGELDGTNFRRIAGKLSLETQIRPKLKLATNVLLGFTDQDLGAGSYIQALLARPDLGPRDAMGQYTNFSQQQEDLLNPVALTTATNNARTQTLLGSLSGSYAISRELNFRSTAFLNIQNYNQRNYLPSYLNTQGYSTASYPDGIGSNANSRFADWFLENTLSFNKQLTADHALNVVIGQSYETTKSSFFRVTASGYPNDNTLTSLSSADTVLGVAGDEPRGPQSYLLSFYARVNYGYLDKYLFTFTGRADGSSKFGPDNKYGYFPSGAVAWRISRENFLKNVGWINDIKLRGSYGLTGNQNIGDQMYRTLYSPVNFLGSTALIPTQLGNHAIKWESTKEADAGLDLALLNSRLYATFDYYNRQTNNALLNLPVNPNTSYSLLLQNAAGLRNRGFEASVGGDIVHGGDFQWAASINITWKSSLVTRLDRRADPTQLISPSGIETVGDSNYYANTTIQQGKPLGLISTATVTAIIKTQAQLEAYEKQFNPPPGAQLPQLGDPIFKLPSAAASYGFLIPLHGSFITNGTPKYFGGMTQSFNYKHFGVQCFFTFSHGGHLFWAQHVGTVEFDGVENALQSMENRYTPTNTRSNDPALSINTLYIPSNLDVFSSSYLKLRSLTVNYNFDQARWMKNATIKSAQIYFSATNVFTLTKYPGSDPETSDDPYSAAGGYIDAGNYPAIRTYTVGVKAVF